MQEFLGRTLGIKKFGGASRERTDNLIVANDGRKSRAAGNGRTHPSKSADENFLAALLFTTWLTCREIKLLSSLPPATLILKELSAGGYDGGRRMASSVLLVSPQSPLAVVVCVAEVSALAMVVGDIAGNFASALGSETGTGSCK